MCLIVFAWKLLPDTPLVVAANRDEYYARAASEAHHWQDKPGIFAGRDLQSHGTWLGIRSLSQDALQATKFAAVTNVRAPSESKESARSRGELVSRFLENDISAAEYVRQIAAFDDEYNGYNLLINDGQDMIWYSNRHRDNAKNGIALAPGIYGVSNAALDTCWHKVVRTKAEFASLICQLAPQDAFFEMLSNTTQAPDCRLPDTGISFERERLLSSPCIVSQDYGTRVSTLLRIHHDGSTEFMEKTLR
ncbi:MAG: NRDE family protein [Undibacterium curvum]|uniref:NRDE family protein n=1 Tax=Undibacterium curvum TaxID=2762294 RepID=UPI003BC754C1